MQATGATGTIKFTGNLVTIRRRSFVGEGAQVRSVELTQVTGLDYRPASAFGPGFIRLLVNGAEPSVSSAHDPNGVAFQLTEQPQFAQIYRLIYEAKYGVQPEEVTTTATPVWLLLIVAALILLYIVCFWFPVVTSIF